MKYINILVQAKLKYKNILKKKMKYINILVQAKLKYSFKLKIQSADTFQKLL